MIYVDLNVLVYGETRRTGVHICNACLIYAIASSKLHLPSASSKAISVQAQSI